MCLDAAGKKGAPSSRFKEVFTAKGWLDLKVSERGAARSSSPKAPYFISVPKRVVNLATRRNRIKRLIREAVRKSALDPGPDKIFTWQVVKLPPDNLGLQSVVQTLKELADK